MSKIEAVLFDFGGVFTSSPFTKFDEIGVEIGLSGGVVHDLVFGEYGQDGAHPWHKLERGEITLEDARQIIKEQAKQKHNVDFDLYELFAKFPRDGGLRKPLVERVKRLKADGMTTAIITNNVKEFSAGWRGLLPVDELFDLVIDSCEVGMRKPNPAIYELTLKELGGLKPENTVFLDDFQGNIDSAKSLGIQTVLVTEDIEAAIKDLDAVLAA